MKQSRRMSLVEAIANVLIGYGLAVLTQILVFPLFGLRTSLSENLAIGLVFTIVSIGRSYILRRSFEAIRVSGLETGSRAESTAASSRHSLTRRCGRRGPRSRPSPR